MSRFIKQILIFTILALIGFASLSFLANGFVDPFYFRFTSPQQQNLILGTSRAAQGIQPSVVSVHLNREVFNYAFTLSHSSYGPTYLKSISKKLDPSTKDGVFILSVDPWCISSVADDPNDSTGFSELNANVVNTPFVNMNPNPVYLYENLSGNYHKILFSNNENVELHKDGWLEVTVDMDPVTVADRTKRKLENYKANKFPYYSFSETRINYLKQTIKFLNKHGSVYLVRLPVCNEMLDMEQQLVPNFDEIIDSVVPLSKGYLDLTKSNEEFIFTDGNHLYKESGKTVSKVIAEWIVSKDSAK